MKILLTGAVIGAVFAGSAMAADIRMPVKAPPAPVAAPFYDWTGFYVGIGAGARWTDIDGSVTSATNNGINILCGPGSIGPCTGTSLDHTAFRISGYVGYNWQVSPQWVVGIEADLGWADNKATLAGAIYPGGNFPFYLTGRPDDSFSVKATWDVGARGRLGYLVSPSVMLFATGGVSWLHIETTSVCGLSISCQPPFFAPSVISHSTERVGWTVGGGVEWMFTPNWLLRGEYRYADYGTFSNTDTRFNPAGPTTQIATYDVDVRTHTALFGIAYKFGGPVVARY